MKNILRRATGAALALVMTAGLLTGCGGETDPIKEAFSDQGYTKDTVVMTVNGADVTAEDFFFWMAQNADYVTSYYSQMGGEVDWTSDMGDVTMDEYVKEKSKETAVLYSLVASQAAEKGYSMTEDDKADYQADLDSAKEQLGGEDEYTTWLKTMLITDEGMERLSSVGVLYSHMSEGLFKEGGEQAATAEDLAQYAEDNDLLYAKHILLMTKDTATGEDLSAEDAAAKKAQAEDLLAQLNGIEDPEELNAKFDELMNANSEDTGLESNPDGYVFSAGQMVEEFESATRALEFGQVSGLVESDYGYHIILRLDPADSDQVQEGWQEEQMDALVQQWVDEAEVVTTEVYDDLTTEDFYATLLAYRETVEPAEEEDASTGDDADTQDQEDVSTDGDADADTQDQEDASTDGDADTQDQEDAPADDAAE